MDRNAPMKVLKAEADVQNYCSLMFSSLQSFYSVMSIAICTALVLCHLLTLIRNPL